MYVCGSCGTRFSEPDSIAYCYEDYFGVSSMFADKHYGHYDACPHCGSEEFEEELDE